jgi:uncharacterized protein (DUF1501 family)
LAAFYLDLDSCGGSNGYTQRLNVVVMSEFGRRLRENANRGSGNRLFLPMVSSTGGPKC